MVKFETGSCPIYFIRLCSIENLGLNMCCDLIATGHGLREEERRGEGDTGLPKDGHSAYIVGRGCIR